MNWDTEKGFDFVLDPVNKRPVEMTNKVIEDYLARKHKRMNSKLVEREDGNWSWVFGALKGEGVDTKGMDLGEAIEKWNEIKGKGKGGKPSDSEWRKKRDKLSSLKDKPDGTYDPDTGKDVSFEDGYQVAFQTSESEQEGKGGYMSGKMYDRMVKEMQKRTGSKAYIGKFDEPEVSFHVKDLKEAMKIAKEHNQHSVWDWKSGDIIKNPWYDPSRNHVKGE